MARGIVSEMEKNREGGVITIIPWGSTPEGVKFAELQRAACMELAARLRAEHEIANMKELTDAQAI